MNREERIRVAQAQKDSLEKRLNNERFLKIAPPEVIQGAKVALDVAIKYLESQY